jgi:hypothetical protein
MEMYDNGHAMNLTLIGLAEKSRTMLCDNLPILEYEPVITEEVVNFRFLGGTLIWLDITSSITMGTAPRLLPYHQKILNPHSQTKLEDIMGCQNWAMLQIGRIAALHEHITQPMQQEQHGCTQFEETVKDISKEIRCGLTQEAFESFNITKCDPTAASQTISNSHTLVTNLYAYMASIYLHLVTHGFQGLESLDGMISVAVRILQTQVPLHLLQSLVSPIYVIGSVARREDEQFFRSILSSPTLLDPLHKHRGKILPVLEQVWSRRQTTQGFGWRSCCELAYDILLI